MLGATKDDLKVAEGEFCSLIWVQFVDMKISMHYEMSKVHVGYNCKGSTADRFRLVFG